MILELGACYRIESPDYGVVDKNAETDHSVRLIEKSMILVLEFMGVVGEHDQFFEHYKILFEDKIIYIVVWNSNTSLDHYLKKIT